MTALAWQNYGPPCETGYVVAGFNLTGLWRLELVAFTGDNHVNLMVHQRGHSRVCDMGDEMTKLEAIERARRIWGFEPNMTQIRPDGGADLDYGYADAEPYGYHRLDANGHVACHVGCQDREREHS